MNASNDPAGKRFTARAVIAFPRVDIFLPDILDAIATHDMGVSATGDGYRVSSPFGIATVEAGESVLTLTAGTDEAGHLNRLKHALAGPLGFIAASEKLVVEWSGDVTGPSHPHDLRELRVLHTQMPTPRMKRIVFKGSDLGSYDRPDQIHCRLIFQPDGVVAPQWPYLDDDGRVVWPSSKALTTRVYTIRDIDAAAGKITIDFFLHAGAGPATRWARRAKPGSLVGILGPAGNGPKPADWYLLAGDETGLPGVARILADLPPQARGLALVEIDRPEDEQPLRRPVGVDLRWLHRSASGSARSGVLANAVRSCPWPRDLETSFFWGGCEFTAFREIHAFLKGEIGLPHARRTLYSHWNRGLSEEDIIAAGGAAYLP